MTLNFPSIVRQILKKVSRAEAVELELDPSQVAASTTKVLSRRSDMHKEYGAKRFAPTRWLDDLRCYLMLHASSAKRGIILQ